MTDTPTVSASILEPLPLPTAAVLAYVAKFGAGALYVLSQPIGFPCLIGASQDVAGALTVARRSWPKGLDPPILVKCFWAHDTRAAQEVMNLAIGNDLRLATKNGPRLAVTVAEAERAILGAARRLSIGLTPHNSLIERAAAAISRIDTGIKAAMNAGQLKFFTTEYQKRRREAVAQGQDFMSWGVAAKRLQEALASIAAGAPVDNGYIIDTVFGTTPRAWKSYPRRATAKTEE